ncbi:Alpha-mannosidase, partial [Caligus rogercresseyi]
GLAGGPQPINGGGKEVIIRYFCAELSGSNSTFTQTPMAPMMKRDLSIDSVSRKLLSRDLTHQREEWEHLHSGEIELMLHRRLLMDDGFGGVRLSMRRYIIKALLQGDIIYSCLRKSSLEDKAKPSMNPKIPIVPEILPQNVHILTLESHFFDIKEDPEYSKSRLSSISRTISCRLPWR